MSLGTNSTLRSAAITHSRMEVIKDTDHHILYWWEVNIPDTVEREGDRSHRL